MLLCGGESLVQERLSMLDGRSVCYDRSFHRLAMPLLTVRSAPYLMMVM